LCYNNGIRKKWRKKQMKKINIELEEQLWSEAQEVLEEYGLDVEGVVKSTLKRIVKQGTAEFIFAKSAPIGTSPEAVVAKDTSNRFMSVPASAAPVASETVKITKSYAKSEFASRGHVFDAPVIFSSRNKATRDYWANPSVDMIKEKWYLILNDQYGQVLRLFEINPNSECIGGRNENTNEPAAVRADMLRLVPRTDKKDLINLQIYGNDIICFTDKISRVEFRPYLIDEVNY
jgi:hypothetical protein